MSMESRTGQDLDFSHLRPVMASFLKDITTSGAYDSLDPKKRDLIARYAISNVPYRLIGEELNIPWNTIRWHVRTGLQKAWEKLPDDLREKYDPEDIVVVKKRSVYYTDERRRKIGEANKNTPKHTGPLGQEHADNVSRGRKGKTFGSMSQQGRENIRQGMLRYRQEQRDKLLQQGELQGIK